VTVDKVIAKIARLTFLAHPVFLNTSTITPSGLSAAPSTEHRHYLLVNGLSSVDHQSCRPNQWRQLNWTACIHRGSSTAMTSLVDNSRALIGINDVVIDYAIFTVSHGRLGILELKTTSSEDKLSAW